MSANNRQVGGNHYRNEYQHWNMVIDTDMPYLLGCATKYVSRWKNKNGTEDLLKAIHYLEKAMEQEHWSVSTPDDWENVYKFANQMAPSESTVIVNICSGFYDNAIVIIRELIEEHDAAEPGPGYVNQG